MTGRITPALALLLALAAGTGAVHAADVVILVSADLPPYLQAAEGVQSALDGAVPESEVVVLSLGGKQERWPAVAERIAGEEPSIVVPVGSLATVLAAQRLEDTALVYTMILNPGKLLEDARSPERITGVSMGVAPEETFRRIRAALPGAEKIGVLYDPGRSAHLVEEGRIAAANLGMELVAEPVKEQKDLPGAVRKVSRRDIDALWLIVDRTVLRTREGLEVIMLETLRKGIPVVAPSERYVKAGALVSMSVDYRDLGVQTGELVLEMRESGVPVPQAQRPRSLVLSVNEKVREALRVEFPEAFREQVSRVVE